MGLSVLEELPYIRATNTCMKRVLSRSKTTVQHIQTSLIPGISMSDAQNIGYLAQYFTSYTLFAFAEAPLQTYTVVVMTGLPVLYQTPVCDVRDGRVRGRSDVSVFPTTPCCTTAGPYVDKVAVFLLRLPEHNLPRALPGNDQETRRRSRFLEYSTSHAGVKPKPVQSGLASISTAGDVSQLRSYCGCRCRRYTLIN